MSVQITVMLKHPDENEYQQELRHVQALKRSGVPVRSFLLFAGVDSGTLTFSDNSNSRIYLWEPGVIPANEKVKYKFFETKYQIHRFDTMDSQWYQVKERPWYWPFWDFWADRSYGTSIPVAFDSLEAARAAIQGRMTGNSQVRSILVDTHQ